MRSKRRSSGSKRPRPASCGSDPLQRLWAPWRIGYIQESKKKKAGCIFCEAALTGRASQVVFKTASSVAMLNIYPYNNGHLMVSPRRHVKDIALLSDKELLDLMRSVVRAQKILADLLSPEGFNIGVNIGRAAGAGIADHVHIHIVPRWVGDTNFMPALGATKIISQSLEELYSLIKDA